MPPSFRFNLAPGAVPAYVGALSVGLFVASDLAAQSAQTVTPPPLMEEIIVWGRALELLGMADSASQGVVGYADFSTRPMLRVGELVEVVPGMIATQHSGPGKANQYFLRGMNLDHGSDFSARFDGVPVNHRTHAHAQGYLDLNFIIPEIVERVEFRKGPYYADIGDFSAVGATFFRTYDRLERGFAELAIGTENDVRIVGGNSVDVGEGSLLYAGEFATRDGPWALPQDVEKLNGMIKYTGRIGGIDAQISGTAYTSDWNATDQIPQRAVDQGLSRFGFIDPDLGGSSSRYTISTTLLFGSTEIVAYATNYEMNLYSNPTYFLNDPVNGDEIEQEDRRNIYGVTFDWEGEDLGSDIPITPRIGGELRIDDASEINLFNTVGRQRIGSVREDSAEVMSLSLYADAEVFWTNRLRTTFGLRADYFDFDVTAMNPLNSGSGSDSLVQPKFGLAYSLTDGTEVYGSLGKGFHTNDSRGVVITVDPVTGNPVDPVDAIVEARGAEIGFRSEAWDDVKFTAAAFWLDLDSELLFVGDAGTSEPSDATKRRGIEFSTFWQPRESLVFDLTAAKTDGRYVGVPVGQDRIPDAHEVVVGAGATWISPRGFTASLRIRHFADAPLTEDGSVQKDDSTLVNLGLSYAFGNFEIGIDVLNLFDANDDDIAYFFESQLAGEPAPVDDIHFHPVESRAVRAMLRYRL